MVDVGRLRCEIIWSEAASIDVCGEVQLPALRLSVAEIVDVAFRSFRAGSPVAHFVQVRTRRIEALFGRFPELSTARDEALGFADDGSSTG